MSWHNSSRFMVLSVSASPLPGLGLISAQSSGWRSENKKKEHLKGLVTTTGRRKYVRHHKSFQFAGLLAEVGLAPSICDGDRQGRSLRLSLWFFFKDEHHLWLLLCWRWTVTELKLSHQWSLSRINVWGHIMILCARRLYQNSVSIIVI